MMRKKSDHDILGMTKKPDWPRRIANAAAGVVVLVLVYGVIYQWVMNTFEAPEEPVSYLQSLQVVIESLTTAGFGGHAPWDSAAGNLMVLLMNLSGVFLVFLAIPLFAVPLIREFFERSPPRSSTLTDHIIVCGYSEKDEVVRRELEHFAEEKNIEIPFLYVEPDEQLARDLLREGITAMVGNPETVETLRAANADQAVALVADVDDETNPSVVLAAKMINEELPVLSVVRDRRVGVHHEYAGADRVIRARESFGRSLAIRASGSYAQKFRNAVQIEEDMQITELVVEDGSELVGQTLADATLYDRAGREANVIAAWTGGKFLISPAPSTPIRKNAILVISGDIDELDIGGVHPIPSSPERASRIVIGGFGTVGRTVWAELRDAGINTTVVDKDKSRGEKVLGVEQLDPPPTENPVDVVGDITDEKTIRQAGLDEADAIVLSLDRDIPTIYSSILIDELAPDVEIIARADEAESISTLYQAGADFVLSLTTVTGEILASELLDLLGEKGGFLPASTEFEFTRVSGEQFAGFRLLHIDLRNETGCTVVAVERGEQLLTDVRGEFTVDEDDTLIIAGSKYAIEQFEEKFLPAWLDRHAPTSDDEQPEPDDDGAGQGEPDDDDAGQGEPDDDDAGQAEPDDDGAGQADDPGDGDPKNTESDGEDNA